MELAKPTGAKQRLLHVVDEMPFVMSAEGHGAMTADLLALLRESGEPVPRQARAVVKDKEIAVDAGLFEGLAGRLCDRLLEQVREWHADRVVPGTHGRRGVASPAATCSTRARDSEPRRSAAMAALNVKAGFGAPVAVRPQAAEPIEPASRRRAWIERCRASIFRREPLLASDDVEDLAATLWDRPSCQQVTPELAVDFLFKDQLNRVR
jgi:hypothetical protein